MADLTVRVPISEQDPLVRAKNFDEVCLPSDKGTGDQDHCVHESHYGGWHRYVRRLPSDGGRKGTVRLCGWSRV